MNSANDKTNEEIALKLVEKYRYELRENPSFITSIVTKMIAEALDVKDAQNRKPDAVWEGAPMFKSIIGIFNPEFGKFAFGLKHGQKYRVEFYRLERDEEGEK